MPPSTMKIKLGEPGKQFLQGNHLDDRGNVDRQPAGLNFYKHHWGTTYPGTVYIENGIHSFKIQHVVSITGTESAKKPEKGLYSFNIRAGITAADYVLHDEARLAFITLLQTLAQAGWRPSIPYSLPRLSGEQAFKYYLEDDMYDTLPVNYAPTLEEWMRIKSGGWYFYAGDLFLDIAVRRGGSQVVDEPGAYLLSISLYGKEEQGRSYFRGKKRDQWQDYWIETIKDLKKDRYAIEEKLIKKGYTIDTGYVEPIVHPADPVEP
ncbi:MAG: hypothetical protein L3J98_12580 [Gammaproteobacteria bacterium]|nr:hypothetical protein [Gammaproteobacteria bacterium]